MRVYRFLNVRAAVVIDRSDIAGTPRQEHSITVRRTCAGLSTRILIDTDLDEGHYTDFMTEKDARDELVVPLSLSSLPGYARTRFKRLRG